MTSESVVPAETSVSAVVNTNDIAEAEAKASRERAERAVREDDARALLAHLSPDAIMNLCAQLACLSDENYVKLVNAANADPSARKLFVRGLNYVSTTEGLDALFAKYGDIEEATVCTDKNTGQSKGYGFVTFKNIQGATQALKHPEKELDGRTTHCNLASQRPDTSFVNAKRMRSGDGMPYQQSMYQQSYMQPQTAAYSGYPQQHHQQQSMQQQVYTPPVNNYQARPMSTGDTTDRKLFCRGLSFQSGQQSFQALFEQYGPVEEAVICFDRMTGQSKGFGFVTYADANSANLALQNPEKELDGRTIHINLAAKRQDQAPVQSYGGYGSSAQSTSYPVAQ